MPILQPLIDSVALDWVTEMPSDLDPEEGLKALLNSEHLVAADGKEALEASLAESRQLLDTVTAPAVKKLLQAQVDQDTAALEKLTKKSPASLATQLATLQEAETTLLRQASERKDKEDVGRKKAAARIEFRCSFLTEIRRELDNIEQAVGVHEAQWEAMHVAKSQVLDSHEKIMLSRLQSRIVAAESPDTTSQGQGVVEAPQKGDDKDAEMKDLKQTLTSHQEKAKLEVAEAKAQAETAAQAAATEHAQLQEQIRSLQLTAAQAEHDKKVTLAALQAESTFALADFTMIPKEVTPKTGDKPFLKICGHLYQLLESWQYGGAITLTIAELSAHSLAKDATQALLRKLLGTQLWEGWFGAVDTVLADDAVLPRQLMAYLQYALSQLKHNYDALQDTKAAAALVSCSAS